MDKKTLRETDATRQVGWIAVRLVDGGQGAQVVGPRSSDFEAVHADAERAARDMPGIEVAIMRCHSVMRAVR